MSMTQIPIDQQSLLPYRGYRHPDSSCSHCSVCCAGAQISSFNHTTKNQEAYPQARKEKKLMYFSGSIPSLLNLEKRLCSPL